MAMSFSLVHLASLERVRFCSVRTIEEHIGSSCENRDSGLGHGRLLGASFLRRVFVSMNLDYGSRKSLECHPRS
eukprot:7459568-Pyramimonas_sp.AAC.1